MWSFVWVGAGGFCGAIARYGVVWLSRQAGFERNFVATAGVNVVGCFLAGCLAGWLAGQGAGADERLRLFALVGLLGGFTTFSAFGLEFHALVREGRLGVALAYAGANVIFSLGAAALGYVVFGGTSAA